MISYFRKPLVLGVLTTWSLTLHSQTIQQTPALQPIYPVGQVVTQTTVTTTAVAPAVPVAVAPVAPPAGTYVDVNARSLAADGTISPQPVRFMVTATTGTPTVQMSLAADLPAEALFINRTDLPTQLQVGPLAEMEMLFVPLGAGNFSSDFALDLINPDGGFFGHVVQFTGPTAQPLAGFGIIYESGIGSTSSPTTGTAVRYNGGNILIPTSNLQATANLPGFSVLIVDPSNGQACRLDTLGVTVLQKQARDADGIIQIKAPFLSDAATSSPRLELFTGQLTNTASEPVAGQPFSLTPPYEALLHLSQFADTPAFYTGTDGRFNLVFDTMGYFAERKRARSWSPLTLTVLSASGTQEFPVNANKDNILQMTAPPVQAP